MGNHAAGRAMEQAALEAVARRQPGESALGILDRICEPWRNCDAEFESTDPNDPDCVHPEFDQSIDPHPKAALGMLMLEAFAPNGLADLDRYRPMLDADDADEAVACDAWWAEVYTPFRQRYEFC